MIKGLLIIGIIGGTLLLMKVLFEIAVFMTESSSHKRTGIQGNTRDRSMSYPITSIDADGGSYGIGDFGGSDCGGGCGDGGGGDGG